MRTVVLIPIHNEKEHLPELLESIPDNCTASFVFVDDGSDDGSGRILSDWANGRHDVHLLRLTLNKGKSAALRRGLQYLIDDKFNGIIVMADGDGQHDINNAMKLSAFLEASGADMEVACRDFSSYSFLKAFGNHFLTWQACILTLTPWRDTQCGLRAFRSECAKLAAESMRRGRYCCEQEMCMVFALRGKKCGNSFKISVQHSRSNSTWRDAWEIFTAGFSVWLDYGPLKYFFKRSGDREF